MKKLIPLLCLFITMTASAASLEAFFGGLEGQWDKVWSESWRETTEGHRTPIITTSFSASVARSGNTWKFSEDICTEEPDGESCGTSFLAYEIINEALFVTVGEDRVEVFVKELTDDYLVIMFETKDLSFTAGINRKETILFQDALIEFADGSQEHHSLQLKKR